MENEVLPFDAYPFEDVTDSAVEEEEEPITVRYSDRFNFQDEPVTVFDFTSGIVL